MKTMMCPMCLEEPLEIKHRILKFCDHNYMNKGLCCVSSQKCTNKWEQVKNGGNELKTVRKS